MQKPDRKGGRNRHVEYHALANAQASAGLHCLELSRQFNTIKNVHPRTKRQKEVLDYITRFMDRNGYEPSYQQIARQLGVSSRAGIQRHVAALESQGLIERRRENGTFGIEISSRKIESGSFCTIEFLETDSDMRVATRSSMPLPRQFIGSLEPNEVFAVRAPDDSMIEKQVCEDDLIFFEKRSYARRGQIVAAMADDSVLKLGLYFHHGLETEIRPANPQFEPTFFPADQITVQGVMRGLVRPLPSDE